jgi:hypothetical protein
MQKIINHFVWKYRAGIWRMAGDITERFCSKDTGEYDDLQEKLYGWIMDGLKRITQ